MYSARTCQFCLCYSAHYKFKLLCVTYLFSICSTDIIVCVCVTSCRSMSVTVTCCWFRFTTFCISFCDQAIIWASSGEVQSLDLCISTMSPFLLNHLSPKPQVLTTPASTTCLYIQVRASSLFSAARVIYANVMNYSVRAVQRLNREDEEVYLLIWFRER